MTHWTIDGELTVLDATIAQLGEHSYLGPWLANVRHDVRRDMHNDIMPSASLAELRTFASELDARRLCMDERERALRARELAIEDRAVVVAQRESESKRASETIRTIAVRLLREVTP